MLEETMETIDELRLIDELDITEELAFQQLIDEEAHKSRLASESRWRFGGEDV
jgi:hypothetical protein